MLWVIIKLGIRASATALRQPGQSRKLGNNGAPLIEDAECFSPKVTASKVCFAYEETLILSVDSRRMVRLDDAKRAKKHPRWYMPYDAKQWFSLATESSLCDIDVFIRTQVVACAHSSGVEKP